MNTSKARFTGALLWTLIVAGFSSPLMAWDGTDEETGADVVIEKGTLVRSGEEIEYYDYSAGEYRYAEVDNITDTGSWVELEITDSGTNEERVLEMERDY